MLLVDFLCLLLVGLYLAVPIKGEEDLQMYAENGKLREYCSVFKAGCLKNEVLMMTSAKYGRMKAGECLKDDEEILAALGNDRRFIGCFSDILEIMDQKCSLKSQCEIRFSNDEDLQQQKPCLATLKSYLEASYECLSVIEPDRSCTVPVTFKAQHLMTSQSSSKLSCGSRHQPWKLEAPAGQQINVSLLDFGGAVNQRDGDCLQYGYVIDREANKNISICGAFRRSRETVYKSSSNALFIYLTMDQDMKIDDADNKRLGPLISIAAVGCSNIVPPEDMWLRRKESEIVIGCYSSRQTWKLTCVTNQWIGTIGNCTRDTIDIQEISSPVKSAVNNEVLASVVIGIIGLIICVIIVICGIVCVKRYEVQKQYYEKRGFDHVGRIEQTNISGDSASKFSPLIS